MGLFPSCQNINISNIDYSNIFILTRKMKIIFLLYYMYNATCMDKTLNMYFYILIFNNLITLNRTYNCLPIALMILHSCCKGCETVAIVIPLRQENYCCSQSEWLVCKLHQWPNVFFISLTTKACHILNVS